ncbi:MAG: PLP-dependent aminotransferase family protein [Actinobacteria bacterium]|nr:PLP-dependent aminotransferase family protein [Actinomycetota bacterium]
MTPVPDDVRARLHERTTQLWAADGVVDLGIGQPQDAILPVDVLSAAMAATAASGRPHPLQYGIEPGDGDLRVAVSDYLEPHYGFCPDPESAFVTNGNSQAIDLVVGTLTEPGDVVLVEEATYFLALDIFANHHVRVVPVAVDDGGIVPEALEEALRAHRPTLVYVVPSFHNPTGATLDDRRREQVVALAAEHGALVVADEVYHLLSAPAPEPDPLSGNGSGMPRPMAAWASSGAVLSLGTFSKILAPGLRLGWVHTSPDLARRLADRGFVVSGGGLNPLVCAVVARALADGSAAAYLGRLRGILGGRAAAMDAALREHLPADVTWATPGGGYFFWLRLPADVDLTALRAAARHEGVDFRPGTLFSVNGGQGDRLRLSFAYYDEETIARAVAALGRAFATLRA